ncbi:squalene/phytoene synthase family protein [Wenzhouxiangella sp. AB-CW3]|uniref:squalene/phytoene synthase family protein n=1 Tax=Wenzhouxiangella sp. AB-CW3 TaxID=2771012 RepID=UPI00168B8EE0|nr:squalene/phytoene synthase family protein [Wenzhouxiangella sp. AB-CW3]QOC21127.1 squalene/phytoene synthase family protein [Wenzhouxiangella sp. AB-CW3]
MEPLTWCREHLLHRGQPLTVSLPYAPEKCRNAILALRSVISEIMAAADGVEDIEPALAKLSWWRRAIHESAAHPALRALTAAEEPGTSDPQLFNGLIDALEYSLECPRFEQRDEAWSHFMAVGGTAARLEAQLVEPGTPLADELAVLGAVGWQIRRIRDLGRDARANRWTVPLDLQAEFQVSRNDALGNAARPGFKGLVRQWLAEGLRRGQEARDRLMPRSAWQHRHLLIQFALDRRLALMIARRPERILSERLLPGHFGNAWTAWRCARQLRRRVPLKSDSHTDIE